MMISSNDLHSENAYSSINVTEEGILIWMSEKHLSKVCFSIDVKEDKISIFVNFSHPQKAYSPIDFTEEGILICVSDENLPNANF